MDHRLAQPLGFYAEHWRPLRMAWRESGKWLPLLFEHSTKAIGEIDPQSMEPTSEGLCVRGHVDQSTDGGEQVWRQIKANTASFSIGFAS